MGWKAKVGSWAANEAVDKVCEHFTGGYLSPSDFLEITNPEDLNDNFRCDNCCKFFTRVDCAVVCYDGDDYQPGDNIQDLVIDVFEHSTGVMVLDTHAKIRDLTNYMGISNFECNLPLTLGMKELVFIDDIANYVKVDEYSLTLNDIIKYYQQHVNELDEYANLSIIDKIGLRETVNQTKQFTQNVTSSKEFKDTISSVKRFTKDLGIEDKDVDAVKSLFKSFF